MQPDDAPLLMTPGPTRLPARVLAAGARAMIHHRTPQFYAVWGSMLEQMRPLFGTTRPILPVHTTGRGAMESVIANLCSPGDELVVAANGRFGELWATIAKAYGVVVHRVAADWSHAVDPADVGRALDEHRGAHAVAMTYSDTSTGVANDVAGVCRAARPYGALVFVDGVSAIGGMPFAFDEWGVDAALTASQKCLMSSPGLAFVVASERAMTAAALARSPRNYWDFRDILKSVAKPVPEPPGTPPVHVVFQVEEALRAIHEEGLEAVYRRHQQISDRVRRGIAELGLSLQCPLLGRFSTTLTAVATPSGVRPGAIVDGLLARGVLVASGLGPYDTTAFRIGHMGDIRMADVDRTLAALADVLRGMPQPA